MEEKSLRENVLHLVGEASMCWDSTGSAIFDSQAAIRVGEKILALIDEKTSDALTKNCSLHEHKWSIPVIAEHPAYNDFGKKTHTYPVTVINCEKCGEIKTKVV